MSRGEHVFQVDARPSDSIALALRLNAPIFTAEQLLDQRTIEAPEGEDANLDAERLKNYLEKWIPRTSASSARDRA
jgi:bifunctional DNase/RNase